jgi:hypothetical protein
MKKTQHIKLILKGCAVGLKYFTYTDEKFNIYDVHVDENSIII